MIVPRFWLEQDDRFVYIYLKIVHIRVHNTEILISDDNTFIFNCDPYFLRLNFHNGIVPNKNGDCDCSYDVEAGVIKFSVLKRTNGEFFNDLGMITQLMTKPRDVALGKSWIEEIDTEPYTKVLEDSGTCLTEGYGFGGRRNPRENSEIFSHSDYSDVFDHSCVLKGVEVRESVEDAQFSDEHYVVDMVDEDGEISALCVPWGQDLLGFSEVELDVLKDLPKRSYLLDRREYSLVTLGLVDILLACSYENVATGGEFNVESPWTVSRVSATLSCCAKFENLSQVVRSFARRCLCYPLYRSRKLVEHARECALWVMESRVSVLKYLLHARAMFVTDVGHYYVLNDVFMTDYCVWVQSFGGLRELREQLMRCEIDWQVVGFGIPQLEIAATLISG